MLVKVREKRVGVQAHGGATPGVNTRTQTHTDTHMCKQINTQAACTLGRRMF